MYTSLHFHTHQNELIFCIFPLHTARARSGAEHETILEGSVTSYEALVHNLMCSLMYLTV